MKINNSENSKNKKINDIESSNTPKVITKESIESAKSSAIKKWKLVIIFCIIMLVRIIFTFLSWAFEREFFDEEIFSAISKYLKIFLFFMLLIWSNNSYYYLIISWQKNLHFNSTWWPTWWWICPIMNLFIPFLTVKDIYKTFNSKFWIVWWRRGCYLTVQILSIITNKFWDKSEYIGLLWILWIWCLIANYALIIKIIKRTNKSLKIQNK